MTNIAHAYEASPSTLARAHSIVWMGGALDHPGNTSPVAEFNCFADPYAATIILDACKRGELKVVLAPLDITTPHQIPFGDLIHPDIFPLSDGKPQASSSGPESASSSSLPPPGPLKTFISTMLNRVRGLHVSFGLPDAMEMHDPVAVWYALSTCTRPALDPGEGWGLKGRDFKVERKGEYTRGMCVVDRRGTTDDGENRAFDQVKKSQEKQARGKASGGNEGSAGLESEERNRDGSKIVKSDLLPMVIVRTPGKEVLRRLILERVLGQTD